jgi:hypothetical protein
MKQFWLFAFEDHDAAGGMRDFVGSYDTVEEAMRAPTEYRDWKHVFDSYSQRVVAEVTTEDEGEWTLNSENLDAVFGKLHQESKAPEHDKETAFIQLHDDKHWVLHKCLNPLCGYSVYTEDSMGRYEDFCSKCRGNELEITEAPPELQVKFNRNREM